MGNKILVSVFDSERTAFEGLTALKDLHGRRHHPVRVDRDRQGRLGDRVGPPGGGSRADRHARGHRHRRPRRAARRPGRRRGRRVRRRLRRADVRPVQGRREHGLRRRGLGLADPGHGRCRRRHRRDVGDADRHPPRSVGRDDVPSPPGRGHRHGADPRDRRRADGARSTPHRASASPRPRRRRTWRRRSTGSGASWRPWTIASSKALAQQEAEFQARLATLREQQAKARESQRQQIDARKVELKASHEARTAKLEEARRLAKESVEATREALVP